MPTSNSLPDVVMLLPPGYRNKLGHSYKRGPAVFLKARFILLAAHRTFFTIAYRCHPVLRDALHRQKFHYCGGPFVAQGDIVFLTAALIGIALNPATQRRILLEPRCNVQQPALHVRANRVLV